MSVVEPAVICFQNGRPAARHLMVRPDAQRSAVAQRGGVGPAGEDGRAAGRPQAGAAAFCCASSGSPPRPPASTGEVCRICRRRGGVSRYQKNAFADCPSAHRMCRRRKSAPRYAPHWAQGPAHKSARRTAGRRRSTGPSAPRPARSARRAAPCLSGLPPPARTGRP